MSELTPDDMTPKGEIVAVVGLAIVVTIVLWCLIC